MAQPTPAPPRRPASDELPARCDVVVIGAGMGGLTSAALLAQQGLDVCVVESERRPGGYLAGFERRGFRFDTAIHWLNQCGPDGLVRRVFEQLGPGSPETPPLRRIRRYKGLGFDYLLTDRPDELAAAMRADAPGDADGVRAFFDLARSVGRSFAHVSRNARSPALMSLAEKVRRGLPSALSGLSILRHSRRTERALPRYFATQRLRDVFCSEANLLSCVMPIGWAYEGDYQLPPAGGSQVFPHWLLERLRASGGRLALATRVTRVLVEDGAVAGVRVAPSRGAARARGPTDAASAHHAGSSADRDGAHAALGVRDVERESDGLEIRCRHVVAACDLHTLYDRLLPPGAVKARTLRRVAECDLYDSAVTLSLGLDVPPAALGFGSELTSLVREDVPRDEHSGPDPHKVALSILAPSLRDASLAPPGKGTLTIYAAARLEHGERWRTGPDLQRGQAYRAYKRHYAEVLLERVEQALAPGLGRHVELCDVATPVTHLRYTGNRGGTMMGARATGRNIRARVARYDTPVRNLVLGGHWADYGGGVPVAVRAGTNSALLVLRREQPRKFDALKQLMDG